MENDSYKTITKPSEEVIFKDKNSKFFGFVFPVTHEDEVKEYLNQLKKKHPNAGHFCYAWQIGVEHIRYRANDDGEPNNSAGIPIYGQLKKYEITNVLVVVVRYFGGTKLGVSGLINAYRFAAKLAIEASEIEEKNIKVLFQLNFEYALMNKVQRIIKENQLKIVAQKLEASCEYEVAVRKKDYVKIKALFTNAFGVKSKEIF